MINWTPQKNALLIKLFVPKRQFQFYTKEFSQINRGFKFYEQNKTSKALSILLLGSNEIPRLYLYYRTL